MESAEFPVFVTQILAKYDTIKTDNYKIEYESNDNEGYPIVYNVPQFEDWENEWEQRRYTIDYLLDELVDMCQREIDSGADVHRVRYLEQIIESCKAWELTELKVEKD